MNLIARGTSSISYRTLMVIIGSFAFSILFLLPALATETDTCPTLLAGDRFKVRGHNAVYLLDDNLRRLYFPHADVYFTWFKDYTGVTEIASSCVDAYPIPDRPPYGVNSRPGTQLVKLRISNSVYAVLPGNKLAKLRSEDVAKQLYGDNWSKLVKDVNDEFWTNFTVQADPIADAKPHDGMIVSPSGESAVYYVNDGQLSNVSGVLADIPGLRIRTLPIAVWSKISGRVKSEAVRPHVIYSNPGQVNLKQIVTLPTPAVVVPTSSLADVIASTTADSAPPPDPNTASTWAISNITVADISSSNATVTWTTNVPLTSGVKYGKTRSEMIGMKETQYMPRVTEHSVKLNNLWPNTKYFFSIWSYDILSDGIGSRGASNVSSTNTFTTLDGPTPPPTYVDTTKPTLTPVLVTDLTNNRTLTEVTLNWSTDEPATTEVLYYPVGFGQAVIEIKDTTLVTEHTVTLTKLWPGYYYNFVLGSHDAAGNLGQRRDLSIKTKYDPPAITNIQTTNDGYIPTETITWDTDVPSNSKVQYGTMPGVYNSTVSADCSGSHLVIKHCVKLPNLNYRILYYYIIKSQTTGGETSSEERTFQAASGELR